MAMQKILIVDDSPTERFFLSELLTSNGYAVLTAENGEDAIEHIRTHVPDLILMDVVMPGQNGFQTTREITRNPLTEHVPIIICTSKNQETDRIWGLRQGARDYIVKPVNTKLLLQKIANHLRPTA
jgi:twitching motility two-component system response regulator PilH